MSCNLFVCSGLHRTFTLRFMFYTACNDNSALTTTSVSIPRDNIFCWKISSVTQNNRSLCTSTFNFEHDEGSSPKVSPPWPLTDQRNQTSANPEGKGIPISSAAHRPFLTHGILQILSTNQKELNLTYEKSAESLDV